MSFQQKVLTAIELLRSGRIDEADDSARSALRLKPRSVDALQLRGVIAGLKNRHADAESFLKKAAAIDEANHLVLFNLAKAISEQGKFLESLSWYKKAITSNPNNEKAWLNYGVALFKLGNIDVALEAFDRSISINPFYPEGYSNKGNCLREKKKLEDAIFCHEKAITIKPDYAEAWGNLGVVLNELKRHREALSCHEKAISLKSDYAEGWSNRGAVLNDFGRSEDSFVSYQIALGLKPDIDFLIGDLVHTQMRICNWEGLETRLSEIKKNILSGAKAITPFAALGLFDDPRLQLLSAEIYARTKIKEVEIYGPLVPDLEHRKIRIGYFSMDFREHPVSYLMSEVIECHDREKFEVYAFSFDVVDNSPMRQHLREIFDKFFDVSNFSEEEIVSLSRGVGLDIAIDLGGYTQDARPSIFGLRAAPVQINYLGYPGTMGSKSIDYFIGDGVSVTKSNRDSFVEKIIYMPNSFQANPRRRLPVFLESSRATYDLPDGRFIFCCLNNSWKITSSTFNIWGRILQRVEKSSLLLYVEGELARTNLRKSLLAMGLDESRLIFTSRRSRDDYLDQYRFVDLFLDTLPYNAGTTASDALGMGLPVLTLAGDSFASRMAASLLNSVGLPDLIAETAERYEEIAVELATHPTRLDGIKRRLLTSLHTAVLFDTRLFTRHLETAYALVAMRNNQGMTPDHISVPT